MQFKYVLLGLVTLTRLHASSGQHCSNGIPGVQKDDICCDVDCGTCGDSNCDQQPGGGDSCCTSQIRDSGIYCSDSMAAPCRIDMEGEDVCSNGLPGVQADTLCCEAQCGTCGGAGCSTRPGGKESCCTRRIRDNGNLCSTTSAAPCIIDNEIKPDDRSANYWWGGGNWNCHFCSRDDDRRALTGKTPSSSCSNGVPGVQTNDICCEAQCGTCGGSGCDERPGGESGCCTSTIEASQEHCSDTIACALHHRLTQRRRLLETLPTTIPVMPGSTTSPRRDPRPPDGLVVLGVVVTTAPM